VEEVWEPLGDLVFDWFRICFENGIHSFGEGMRGVGGSFLRGIIPDDCVSSSYL